MTTSEKSKTPDDHGEFCICSCAHTRLEINQLRARVQELEREAAELDKTSDELAEQAVRLEREVAALKASNAEALRVRHEGSYDE